MTSGAAQALVVVAPSWPRWGPEVDRQRGGRAGGQAREGGRPAWRAAAVAALAFLSFFLFTSLRSLSFSLMSSFLSAMAFEAFRLSSKASSDDFGGMRGGCKGGRGL